MNNEINKEERKELAIKAGNILVSTKRNIHNKLLKILKPLS